MVISCPSKVEISTHTHSLSVCISFDRLQAGILDATAAGNNLCAWPVGTGKCTAIRK